MTGDRKEAHTAGPWSESGRCILAGNEIVAAAVAPENRKLIVRAVNTYLANEGASVMHAFGASDAACYHWPDDTQEHRACRAAYIRGAADTSPSPIPEGQLAAQAILDAVASNPQWHIPDFLKERLAELDLVLHQPQLPATTSPMRDGRKATVRIEFPETPAAAALLRLGQMVQSVELGHVAPTKTEYREALDGWLSSSRTILREAANGEE